MEFDSAVASPFMGRNSAPQHADDLQAAAELLQYATPPRWLLTSRASLQLCIITLPTSQWFAVVRPAFFVDVRAQKPRGGSRGHLSRNAALYELGTHGSITHMALTPSFNHNRTDLLAEHASGEPDQVCRSGSRSQQLWWQCL
jgi:hypothetical protein